MNRGAGDEIFDWDMNIDDDEETLEEEFGEYEEGNQEADMHDSYVATSPKDWVSFSREGGLDVVDESSGRRAGDGISLDSQQPYTDDRNESGPTEYGSGTDLSQVTRQHYSTSGYLPTNGQSETARFKVLDDEYDISSDLPAMQFRGSLKTDADMYGKGGGSGGGRCCCRFLRYFVVALLAFTVGILLGFVAAGRQSPVEKVNLTESPAYAVFTTSPVFADSSHVSATSPISVAGTSESAVVTLNDTEAPADQFQGQLL